MVYILYLNSVKVDLDKLTGLPSTIISI